MTGARILLVEDNDKNLKLVRHVLQFAGFEVLEAQTGEEGVAVAKTTLPDLVLMDLQLPGIDGTEALRRLRAYPTTAELPVVAVTAFAMKDDGERIQRAGFDGYITKPLNIRSLPDQVRGYLRREEAGP
jgi:two-component system cell cycle response regulator DivK